MTNRPRLPGLVYSTIVVVLVVVLGVVAFSTQQPPPPTIAEFAPSAVEKIEEAPEEQTTGTEDDGSCPPDQPGCDATPPTPTPGSREERKRETRMIDVPRVRRCIGDPPRQIEDPQAPPCVPYWAGDNGGATSKGVTRDEIRIANPAGSGVVGEWNPIVWSFFNKRFEFYGRKIRLVDVEDLGCEPENQRATAATADSLNVFASDLQSDCDGWIYHAELARRKIVSSVTVSLFTEESMQRRHPYLWQYQMSADRILHTNGNWTCARLAGHNAEHAGDPSLRSMKRKFGIIIDRDVYGEETDSGPLRRALARCDVEAEEVELGGESNEVAANVMLRMKTEGVTSLFCPCDIFTLKLLGDAATPQGYFPEWIIVPSRQNDTNAIIRDFGPSAAQRRQYFGITVHPRQQPLHDTPATWALKEMDPNWTYSNGFDFVNIQYHYWTALFTASAIQMAGPNLTPETFAEGLRKAAFPNPPHPIMPGAVGFQDGDHSMTNDAAEWWWSETGTSPYPDEGAGTVCYVDGGARHTAETWGKEPDELFEPPCDSGG